VWAFFSLNLSGEAELRELASSHGLEHEPGMKLLALISDDMNLSVAQMLELAQVLPRPESPMLRTCSA
jgi:hypothetical protein